MVSDEKQIYHCFGCSEGGDIFQFVMKFDGIGFAEAVQYLAGRAGIELAQDDGRKDAAQENELAKRKRLCLRVNEIARDFFVGRLADRKAGAHVRRYLQHRGISEEIWTQLFLGYADNSWDALASHLEAKGVPLELAAEIGLIKPRTEGRGFYDFFRNRLMFAIVSPRGEVLGFGGRTLEEEERGENVAKYINSPDSLIYHKSNCVYGLDKAAQAIRGAEQVILVEGYMDMIALRQAGIENVVAPLGTALTSGHLRLLSRYTRNLVVIFDGDEAGRRAALRALPLFLDAGLMPRVVPLPESEDPDSTVRREGGQAFRERLRGAPSLFEYFVDRAVEQTGLDTAGKAAAVNQVVPLLKQIADPAEHGIWRGYLSRRLSVDEGVIASAIRGSRSPDASAAGRPLAKGAAGGRDEGVVVTSVERALVETMLRRPDVVNTVFTQIDVEHFEEQWSQTVARLLYDAWQAAGVVRTGEMIGGIADAELASQLREVAMGPGRCDEDEIERFVSDCVARLKSRPAARRLEQINEDLRRAEKERDDDRVIALLEEKRKLASELRLRK